MDDYSPPPGGCSLCDAVARYVEQDAEAETYLWNFTELESNKRCQTCQLLVEALKACRVESPGLYRKEPHAQGDTFISQYDRTVQPYWLLKVYPESTSDKSSFSSVIMFGRVSARREAAVDAPTIDFTLVDEHVKRCDNEHAGQCHTIDEKWATIEPTTGLMFIDVEKRCLVGCERHCRYIALSYVWDHAEKPFQTIINNVEHLSLEGAFDLSQNKARLPRTIRDSMQVTRSLGIRYLWVDRFCIIQDDEPSRTRDLAAMASIYGNSYFTLVAIGASEEDSGLLGVDEERPRCSPFRKFNFSPDCQMYHYDVIGAEKKDLKYFTRGWTYQEWALSRRRLVFHHSTVTWFCQELAREETGFRRLDNCLTSRESERKSDIWFQWPNIRAYLMSVERYSRRDLTVAEDVLNAFAAFVTIQGRTMRGGVFFGMPELFFCAMMLWQPMKSIRRRLDKNGRASTRFPSWSWVGWIGQVNTPMVTNALDHDDSRQPWSGSYSNLRFVEFFKVAVGESEGPITKRVRIQDLHTYRGQASYEATWPSSKIGISGLRKFVPLVDDMETQTPVSHQHYTGIIEFRTRRLFAFVRPPTPEEYVRNRFPLIVNQENVVIGHVDYNMFFDDSSLPSGAVELVAIGLMEVQGMGLIDSGFNASDYFHRSCPKLCYTKDGLCKLQKDWKLRFYNILWIEREDGIAYRKHVGKVWQEAWDAAETEEIDVRLG